MNKTYIRDTKFQRIDFAKNPITKADHEHCSFNNCNFSNADLAGINFLECEFINCNLSLAKISNSAFRDVKFNDCKLLGLHFNECNEFLFAVEFENCMLNLSSFYKLKLKKTKFKNCSLHEADFTETDLSASVFDDCDLARAIFENTILEKTDFRTSYHYSIDPELNRIKKAMFSKEGIIGLLDRYDIEIS